MGILFPRCISFMDLRSGSPYFLLKNGYPYSYASLSENISTDVLVIGAGISGALTAYYLLNSGVRVTVVDKRHPAMGSTCASTSILDYELDVGLADLSEKIGRSNATACYLLCMDAIYVLNKLAGKQKTNCEMELKKVLYVASRTADIPALEKELKARREIGIAVDFVDHEELRNKFSITAHAALLSENGGQMDAFNFTHAILKHITNHGGNVFGHTEIKNVQPS